MSYLTEDEISKIGFKSYGTNLKISDKVSFYLPENISFKSNIRIDDFCILSGNITVGNYVHISAYSALFGANGIEISDFCGISPRCTLLSASDDFSGEFMISPMVPKNLTNVTGGLIKLNKYVQIGAGSILMPNIELSEGSAVGAMSFVNCNLSEWTIYAGCPAEKIKNRKRNILDLSKQISIQNVDLS